MRTLSSKSALSRSATVGIIVVVIIIIVAAAVLLTRPSTSSPTVSSTSSATSTTSVPTTTTAATTTTTATTSTTTTSSSSTTSTSFQLGPTNRSELVDESAAATAGDSPPDDLDPATGFFVPDQPVFTNVFQQLVEFNGSSFSQVVPVLASNYSIENDYQTYVFSIRPNVEFSNGDPLTAADVWFSYVREVYLGQAVGISNYAELTVNTSTVAATGLIIPWGIQHAIQSVTGLPAETNPNVTKAVLNNILSNFNPNNATIQKIMSYPNQAYVVTGPMTFEINLMVHYRFFLQDISAWWGAIVDPAYVDAHGGVQANTPNSYFDANGGPGTGPYEIRSIAASFSTIVLQPNPHYWGINGQNVPAVAQAPHIPIIIINYGLSQNARIEDFGTNAAQISFTDTPTLFGQMYNAYQYKQYYSFNQILDNLGLYPAFFYISMNTQKYPTNNNDFRLAIVHAINYTQVLDESYGFNGQVYGQIALGPVSPSFSTFYNPGNLPMYNFNINLAAYYLNLAGQQEDFSVTMPNGTVLGNTSAPPLEPLTIYYVTPQNPLTEIQLTIIQNDLSKLGLDVGFQGVTTTIVTTWTTAQLTPNFVDLGWIPDWPDPILQQIAPAITTTSYLPAWVNLSSVNQIMATLPFLTNQTQQVQLVKELYNITYNYAPYAWLPDPDLYLFVQPYVKGFTYNVFMGYWYNMMYYPNSTS